MTFNSPCRRVISSSLSAIRAKSPKCTISSRVNVGMPITICALCDSAANRSPYGIGGYRPDIGAISGRLTRVRNRPARHALRRPRRLIPLASVLFRHAADHGMLRDPTVHGYRRGRARVDRTHRSELRDVHHVIRQFKRLVAQSRPSAPNSSRQRFGNTYRSMGTAPGMMSIAITRATSSSRMRASAASTCAVWAASACVSPRCAA